jgi:urease accessory protein
MRAHAVLEVARDSRGTNAITRLRSDGPIMLRPTPCSPADAALWRWPDDTVQVCRAAAAAGPLGGDDLRLDVRVGPESSLVLSDVSATLALPGPHGLRSHMRLAAEVGPGGFLALQSQPLIAATACDHRMITEVDLAADARLIAREELLLGRHGEEPGSIGQRLRVCRDGRPVYDQDVVLGVDDVPGWRGPAVAGGRRAVGSVLLVGLPADASNVQENDLDDDTAVMHIGAGCVVVTSVAPDRLTLRRRLDGALRRVQRAPALQGVE